MYTLKEKELPPSKGKHCDRYTDWEEPGQRVPCADSSLGSLVTVWGMVIYNPSHSHLHYELQNTSCYSRDMGMLQVQKNHTFQDSVKSTLPLLASSMFMADLSMGIISHPYILREDIGQMTENTLKQHRIGNLKIFTGKEAHRTEIEVIASCGQVWCSLFETQDLFGVCFSLLKHNESASLWAHFPNEGAVCD